MFLLSIIIEYALCIRKNNIIFFYYSKIKSRNFHSQKHINDYSINTGDGVCGYSSIPEDILTALELASRNSS